MSNNHHATLPPSAFPMLAKCPCYKSGKPGEAARSGHRQHRYLEALLTGQDTTPAAFECDDTETAQVQWAAEYVRTYAGENRKVEERLSLFDDDFSEITFGTLDVVAVVDRASGNVLTIMDYKSGEDHGYLPQMAVYARAAMIAYDVTRCEIHELYGRRQWAKRYALTMANTDFVMDIIAAVRDPERQPAFCEFCNWCEKSGTCPEAVGPIVQVATEYEPESPAASLPLFEVTTWHASEITDPNQMAVVLAVAEHVGKWAESAKHGAKEAAYKGMAIPGYTLKDGRSSREFSDVAAAYEASGLEPGEFLACCKASVPAVSKAIAAKNGHKSSLRVLPKTKVRPVYKKRGRVPCGSRPSRHLESVVKFRLV